MDNPKRSDRLKSESSEDEEDFESADEGEESEQGLNRPPSLQATSADDDKNSTSESQVTKDRSTERTEEMAAPEPSSPLTSTKSDDFDDFDKTDGDSLSTNEMCPTGDINSKSADLQADSSHSDLQEEKAVEKQDTKPSGDQNIAQNVAQNISDDKEIQINIDPKKVNEDTGVQLDDTLTDETVTMHKETTVKQDDEGDVKRAVEEEEGSSCEKKQDDCEGKLKENLPDKSQSNVDDSDEADKESSERSAELTSPESTNPEPVAQGGAATSEPSWGWGSWGTMLSSVSSGLSSVIETVETTLGIPEPEVVAKQVAEDEKQAEKEKREKIIETEPTADSLPAGSSQESETAQGEEQESSYFSGFGVRGLSDVVSEGLGALEYIGKKTMDVISEGDPGLRNKRETLMPKEATLSQMLREAKEEAEYKASHPNQEEFTVHFSTEFDKFQGLAHLEALEILSKESLSKVEAHIIDLSSEDLKSVKPLLRTIQEVVKFTEDEEELEDSEEQNFESEVSDCLKDLNLAHIPNKTNKVDRKAKEWIDACITEQKENPLCKDQKEVFAAGLSTLAELTASTVEQFHKIAEVLLLLEENKETSALVRAQSLKKLTLCVCKEVSGLSSKFAGCLSTVSKESEDPEAIESLITTLYLESSDSSRYLQHALKLLCPVLQHSSLSETTGAGES